ncbi:MULTISPECIES: carbohydrate ABC transporter permease [Pseudovibrio]|uniref:sn-glycerol-3-phosphate transport system permease protein UgpE n=1 Tax=Pseudovibrio ascidiaceicola TaxID=285279 RepID=A0A1I3ZVZ7_9HYPH|nr:MULTISPECIES: carbohydrate ABC transporter permease [Pseudovibrio]KZL24054.1 L-arabinose transport system permease protein AraQ [Pseudovibrio sp. Ad37]SFK47699.1 carbohydrate ABC transporter membrane protein 2, CUT1 family (TC 3.A.1.1.-) [Pseudovibrio ascidiaceicola]
MITQTPKWPVYVLGSVALVWIIPLVGIIAMSIRPEGEITSGWWTIEPFTFTLDAWREVWVNYPIGRAFLNSLAVASFATVLPVLFAPAAAYAFHYLKFPFRRILLLILVNAFVVPNQVVIIPLFKLWRETGLIDTYWSVVIPFVGLSFAWAVLLVKNFLSNFPRSLIDAAQVDGCGHLRTYFFIVLPNTITAMAAVGILQFMWTWNSLLLPMLFLRENATLPVMLSTISGAYEPNWDQRAVATIITSILPLVIFLFFQKYFSADGKNNSGSKG